MVLSPHTALFAPCTVWDQRWNHPIVCTDASPTTKSVGLRNILEVARRKFRYWREENQLQKFTEPYQKSRAILVAIDDYARKKDGKKRSPTRFRPLTSMVTRAEELKKVLVSLGFQEHDIL